MKIDEEFSILIPALADQEFALLEKSLLAEGCRDPLVVWNDTLVDGHNRFRICEQHKIKYNTVERQFQSRDEAKQWILENQLARRNLTPFQRVELALRLEDHYRAKAKANQMAGKHLLANLPEGTVDTRKELAKVAAIGERTLDKARLLSERASPDVKEKLRTGDISIDRAYNQIKQHIRREKVREELAATPLPMQKFRVIYADPPWKYGNSGLDDYGHAERHYPTMTVQELCDLPVADLAADDAVLLLWATSPMLPTALKVMEAWGFTYKSSFVWDKVKHNFGYYNSVRHEFLLVATKGSCLPDVKELHDSVVSLERTDHSTKPEYFRELIDKLYTNGKRIELFARKKVNGWEVYGNQIGG